MKDEKCFCGKPVAFDFCREHDKEFFTWQQNRMYRLGDGPPNPWVLLSTFRLLKARERRDGSTVLARHDAERTRGQDAKDEGVIPSPSDQSLTCKLCNKKLPAFWSEVEGHLFDEHEKEFKVKWIKLLKSFIREE